MRDDADENFYLMFPTLGVQLHFTWIEGVLAGNSIPLVRAIEDRTNVENALGCVIVHVSTHACYAENAAKHVKCRVRSKLSSLIYCVNRTVLSYVVVGGINGLNLTTR